MSTVYLAKETLPAMQQRRWGRFIAITSVSVKQPVDGLILSNSIRAGVSGLVKTLANEYGPWNVLVNNVCPGYTATARLLELAETLARKQGVTPREIEERWASRTPLRPHRAAGGIRQPGGIPGVGARQLYHRRVHRGGRRGGEGIVLKCEFANWRNGWAPPSKATARRN